jgi:hypothetical protein
MTRLFFVTRFFTALVLVFGQAACSESTAPVAPTEVITVPSVMVLTAVATNSPEGDLSDIMFAFGNQPVDSMSLFDGQPWLMAPYSAVRIAVVNPGETVTLVSMVNFTYSIEPDAQKPAVFEFISDWGPVDEEKHPGIRVVRSEVGLIINGDNWRTGVVFPRMLERTVVTSRSIWVKKSFAATQTGPSYNVTPKHKFEIRCLGDDNLTFRSKNGILLAHSDRFRAREVVGPALVQEVNVSCKSYSSKLMAELAIRGVAGQ